MTVSSAVPGAMVTARWCGARQTRARTAAGLDRPGRTEGLTDRESEILAVITQGMSNAQVAEPTFLSPNTVKSYIRTIYRKMGVGSRTQAVLWGWPTLHAGPPPHRPLAGRTVTAPGGPYREEGAVTGHSGVEVTALAINVTIPEALRWTDTRRGETFTLTTINVRLRPDGRLAAKAYGRPVAGGRGTYVSFAVPDEPELTALVAAAADRAGALWAAHRGLH